MTVMEDCNALRPTEGFVAPNQGSMKSEKLLSLVEISRTLLQIMLQIMPEDEIMNLHNWHP